MLLLVNTAFLVFAAHFITAKPAANLELKSLGKKNSVNSSDIEFLLYTQANRNAPDRLYPNNRSSILGSHFVYGSPIKMIIHGNAGSAQDKWMQDMKNAYLETERNYNVILVDWGKLCQASELSTIINIYVTGKYAALILDELIHAHVADLAKAHVIGHSFGAHVSAFTANLVRTGVVPRITGLDPAKLFFDGFGNDARIDPTDAPTVDVIHSAGGIVAFQEPRGTVDFYPNGGQFQPGCSIFNGSLGIECNHMRATDLFVESIRNMNAFHSCKCADYNEYKRDTCPCQESTNMGEYVNIYAEGLYYLETNAKSPFTKEAAKGTQQK